VTLLMTKADDAGTSANVLETAAAATQIPTIILDNSPPNRVSLKVVKLQDQSRHARSCRGAAGSPGMPIRSYSAMTWAPSKSNVAAISRLASTTMAVVSDP
jgi:hypothetical protein